MRYSITTCALSLIVAASPCTALSQNINASEFLNNSLRSKPPIAVHRNVVSTKRSCRRFKLPKVADGGDTVSCNDETINTRQDYSDYATTSSSEIVEVRDLKFNDAKIVSLPIVGLMSRREFFNCGQGTTIGNTQTMEVSGTEGYSVLKSNGVTTTIGGSVQMNASYSPGGVGGFGGSLQTTLSMQRQVSTRTDESESHSQTVRRQESWTLSAPPNSIGSIEFFAYQVTVDIPFSANVIVDGQLAVNDSGLQKTSAILSEAERTLPFDGVLRMTGVSEGRFRVAKLPGEPKCPSSDYTQTTDYEQTTLQGQKLANKYISYSGIENSTFKDVTPQLKRLFPENLNELTPNSLPQPDLEVKDNIIEDIISAGEVIKRSDNCPLQQDGPGLALFDTENRRFHQYEGGYLSGSWSDTVYKFKSCYGDGSK
jgi:hypothetical protein